MEPIRVTERREANEQLLYFTSSSLWGDDSHIVFLSDATGDVNVFMRNLVSGAERQLTHNVDGYLKSYVYFDGLPYRGFGKASVSMDPASGTFYFIQGQEIRKVDAMGHEEVLAHYPEDQMTAFTHVSADGKRLCVPTTDARALDGERRLEGKPEYDIDERVRREGLSSYLRVFDTESGEQLLCERVEGAWITHVQFAPQDNDLILYNHEWPSDRGIRRMWLFDGERHIRLRPESESRSRLGWVCHEMWERDGSALIYHGRFPEGGSFIGRVRADGTGHIEIPLPTGCDRYGHFTVGPPGVLVSDGYYEEQGDAEGSCGDWISSLSVDWPAGRIGWTPLCRSASSWASQDAHPHPVLDHAGKQCYFTSDREGKRAIYRISLEDRA